MSTYLDLSNLTKFRLDEINIIKDYFEDYLEQETMIKKLSKYMTAFDYIDKILIVLSATSGGVSIISHVDLTGTNIGIISSILIVVFSLTTGIVKKSLIEARKKKKKHSKIIMLANSKLNNIETLISQAIIDLEISHEEFKIIVDEKEKYDKMNETIRNTKNQNNINEDE